MNETGIARRTVFVTIGGIGVAVAVAVGSGSQEPLGERGLAMQTIEVAAPRLLFVGRGEEMTSEVSVKGTTTGEGVGAGAGARTGDRDMRVDGEVEARVGTMTEWLNATVSRHLRVRSFGFLLGSFVGQPNAR